MAQQQGLCPLVVAGQPLDGQITARGGSLDALNFSLLDGLQQGNSTFIVVVDADAQIDFFCARISVVLLVETKNGIAGCQFDSFEDRGHVACMLGKFAEMLRG